MADRWFGFKGMVAKYSLSEGTLRRLMAAGKWPRGERVTANRVVCSEAACDEAFRKLLAERRSGETDSQAVA